MLSRSGSVGQAFPAAVAIVADAEKSRRAWYARRAGVLVIGVGHIDVRPNGSAFTGVGGALLGDVERGIRSGLGRHRGNLG